MGIGSWELGVEELTRFAFSPELKKGSTEMLILSLVEVRPRHGYEIGKLIEARSGGRLTFALPTH